MVSRPQNHEFRNNPENFHPCVSEGQTIIITTIIPNYANRFMNAEIKKTQSSVPFFMKAVILKLHSLQL